MACPMGYRNVRFNDVEKEHLEEDMEVSQNGVNKMASSKGISYGDYIQLPKLLDCQSMISFSQDVPVPDEHLFIIVHQTYELWFKQIIFDIDHVRMLMNDKVVDETKTLKIVNLLERTVKILKLLVDQILILETMSPLDFAELRRYLTSASGFQSLQFRLFENKFGVKSGNRIKYNRRLYRQAFEEEEVETLVDSETTPTLFQLIEKWLERTPGVISTKDEEIEKETPLCNDINDNEKSCPYKDSGCENNVNSEVQEKVQVQTGFWPSYVQSVEKYLKNLEKEANNPELFEEERNQLQEEFQKTKISFETILNNVEYNKLLKKRESRLSHNAMKGALMIYCYRDMPRFSQPYQILTFLMDIDSLLQKWRHNHVMLVQRMIGSKQGTEGGSGYLYLRTTVSNRYKVFLDLFNLSTWLIPRAYIPELSPRMVQTLSQHTNLSI